MIRFPFLLLCLLLSVACGRRHTAVTDPEFSATAPGDSLHAVRIPVGGDFLGEYPVLTLGERIVMQNSGLTSVIQSVVFRAIRW